MYEFSWGHVFSILLHLHLRVALLGIMGFRMEPFCFLQWLPHFTMHKGWDSSTFSPALAFFFKKVTAFSRGVRLATPPPTTGTHTQSQPHLPDSQERPVKGRLWEEQPRIIQKEFITWAETHRKSSSRLRPSYTGPGDDFSTGSCPG